MILWEKSDCSPDLSILADLAKLNENAIKTVDCYLESFRSLVVSA